LNEQRNKVIDYSQFISDSTVGFVGRGWVLEAVVKFLDATEPRFFLLMGEPGCGKTTFMADLISQRGYPHHFIGKGSQGALISPSEWRDPVRFAESIGYQLLRDYGGWVMKWEDWGISVRQEVKELEGLLKGAKIGRFKATPRPAEKPKISIEQEAERFGPAGQAIGVYIENFEMDIEQIVHQLVTVPLQTIAQRWPHHQVVIVVDGLDEAASYSNLQQNILGLLPHESLPTNVRYLLSSRPGEHLSPSFLSQVQVFWLSEDKEGNRDPRTIEDAEEYVLRLTQEELVSEILGQANISSGALAERVARASQGNFLYLHHYAEGMRSGDRTLLDLEALPEGLYGIYSDFLSKIKEQRADVSWDSVYKPVLGALAVSQEPVSRTQIAGFSEVAPETVGTILVQLKQFLERLGAGSSRRYRIYHTSFGEYLVSEENEDYIHGQAAHARIVERYRREAASWGAVDWIQVDNYGLRHLAYHLREAEYKKELYALLTESPKWMSHKFLTLMGDTSYLADLELAIGDFADPLNASEILILVKLYAARQIVSMRVSRYGDPALRALVWLGRENEALAHVRLRNDVGDTLNGLLTIYQTLAEKGLPDPSLLSEIQEVAQTLEDKRWWAEALARSERYEEARQAALDIDDDEPKADALVRVAYALVEIEHYEEARDVALEVALTIDDEEQRVQVLTTVANALAQAERCEEARDVALAIKEDWRQAEALIILAETLARAGRYEETRMLALTIDDEQQRARALVMVANALAQAGRYEEAREEALAIKDDLRRAEALTQAGSYEEARELALTIKNEEDSSQTSARITLAEALAHAGRYEEAREEALATEGEEQRMFVLMQVADALAQAGSFKEARDVALAIREDMVRPSVLASLTDMLAQAGRYEEARQAALDIDDDQHRADAMARVAYVLARVGDNRRARALLEESRKIVPDSASYGNRALALSSFASALAQVGNNRRAQELLQEAREVTLAIEGEFWRTTVLSDLARSLAEEGDCEEARELVLATKDEDKRVEVLTTVAYALVKAGCFKEAREVVLTIDADEGRMELLGRVAKAIVQAGSYEDARVVALAIEDEEWRADALAILAYWLAGERYEEARQAALDIEDDQRRADVLSRIEHHERREAFRAIIDEWDRWGAKLVLSWIEQPEGISAIMNSQIRAIIDDQSGAEAQKTQARSEDAQRRVTALAQAGSYEEAREVALAIEADWIQEEALLTLTEALAKVERYEEAREVTLAIKHKEQQANALARVADALAEARRFSEALTLLAVSQLGMFHGPPAVGQLGMFSIPRAVDQLSMFYVPGEWALYLEQIKPGLSFTVFCGIATILGWESSEWEETAQKLRMLERVK
jgi:hypothetical protein